MVRERTTRAAAYAVASDGERILLTRLSVGSRLFRPGLWHPPGGGVQTGEQPYETVAREVREETRLVVQECRLLDARTFIVDRPDVSVNLVAMFFEVVVDGAAPLGPEGDEATSEVAWLSMNGFAGDGLSPPALHALTLSGEGIPGYQLGRRP